MMAVKASSKSTWIMIMFLIAIFMIARSQYPLNTVHSLDGLKNQQPNHEKKDVFPEQTKKTLLDLETPGQVHDFQSNDSKSLNNHQLSTAKIDETNFGVMESNIFLSTMNLALRLDWRNLSPTSQIAKQLLDHQNNCSLPVRIYDWRVQEYGLGSDIHVWGNQLWAGLLYGHRVRSPNSWIWVDKVKCGGNVSWHCYFPTVEPICAEEVVQYERILAGTCKKYKYWPENTYNISDFRAAATEFVFSHLSETVIQEANRQLDAVFGKQGVPENLITLHIRWGDKVLEGSRKNIPIQRYVSAIKTLVQDKNISSVHILLCTEDPKAAKEFQAAVAVSANKSWKIYMDHFYTEFLPYRENRSVVYNVPSMITKELQGKPGLWAMGSLLVAMEANHFVLTTKSNWARLMNELRKNVLNPRCGNCTTLIDLEEGEC
jgi:hypothetical protein